MAQENDYDLFQDNTDSSIELAIFKTFCVDLLRLIKMKMALSKNWNISFSEIDNLMYWEYEYLLLEAKDQIDKEKAKQEDDKNNSNFSPRDMLRQAKSSIPNFSNIKMPKL